MIRFNILFYIIFLLYSCERVDDKEDIFLKEVFFQYNGTQFKLYAKKIFPEKKNDNQYFIIAESFNKNKIKFKYFVSFEIYNFECGDINCDGFPDLVLGVIKKTRFDPLIRKRLMILSMKDYRFSHLWLGSRVSQPLENFHIKKNDKNNSPCSFVKTIEKEQNGNYLVASYKWQSFGLKFMKYISRNISLNESYKILKDTKNEAF